MKRNQGAVIQLAIFLNPLEFLTVDNAMFKIYTAHEKRDLPYLCSPKRKIKVNKSEFQFDSPMF